MKTCPHCGKEYSDKSQYCLECGTLLEKKLEPPRESLLDHIKYGVKVAQMKPKVFLPIILIYVGSFVMLLVIGLSVGVNAMYLEDPSQFSYEMFSSTTILLVVGFIIVMFYVALISEPFLQHVYLTAATGEEISLWDSLRYAHSRLLAFLGAYLLSMVVVIPVMFLWLSKIPYEVLMQYEDYSYELLLDYGLPLLLFIPVGILYTIGLDIMVWANLGFFKAINESMVFLKHSFMKLLGISVIQLIIGGVSTRVPFGAIISYFLYIILNISMIDVYMSYRASTNIESISPDTL